MNSRRILVGYCVVVVLAAMGAWCSHAQAERSTGNRTPYNYYCIIWSPTEFELGDGGEAYTKTSMEGQNYIVVERINSTLDDTPDALLSHLQTACGVRFHNAHGNTDAILAEAYQTSAARDTAFNAYVAGSWSSGAPQEIYKHTQDYTPPGGSKITYYAICVTGTGVTNELHSTEDSNGTIIFAGQCHSDGLKDNHGGREYFGYNACVNCPETAADSRELWDHMTGIDDNGNSRPASDAYTNGTYNSTFKRYSPLSTSYKTTLCPAVADHFPLVLVCGDCYGYVKFDTKMNTVYDSEVVSISNSGTLTDFSWTETNSKLNFKTTNVNAYESYTFTVNWNYALSADQVTYLDGNQNPVRTDAQRPNGGSAEGAGDFKWTVTGDALACDPSFIQSDKRNLLELRRAREAHGLPE